MATHPDFKWRKFGAHLKAFREEKGYGLRESARALKIHHATWCRAEQGKPITVPIFIFICDWMNASPFQYAIRRA